MLERKFNRRDFLRLSAVGLGALAASQAVAGCSGSNMRFSRTPPAAAEGEAAAAAEGEGEAAAEVGQGEAVTAPAAHAAPAAVTGKFTSAQGLMFLLQGNQRFVSGQVQHPRRDAFRRADTLGGQTPFAVVLTCSDSRVAPEVIFDQGVGDIFVVRTAGNIAGEIALGSIEYAVEHLNAPLVLVLGHQKCGAVSATVDGGEAPGHIKSVVEHIAPAVERARGLQGDLLANAIDTNILETVHQLRTSAPILAEFVNARRLEVFGARYNLDTGSVTFL